MAQSRKHRRKHISSKKRFKIAKGFKAYLRSPIPPSPIPPPQAPSPLMPLPYLPIPPPPNPLTSRPTRRKKRWPRRVSFVENLKK
jgi:hypothetical protein